MPESTEPRPHKILLVEDNRGDAILLRRALLRENGRLDITQVESAEAAGARLTEGLLDPRLLPNLMIVDINLPGISGLQFLERYKADDRLRYIPSIVMSSSDNPVEVRRAYEDGASGYVKKPTGSGGYDHIACCLTGCWLDLMELPQGDMTGPSVPRFAGH